MRICIILKPSVVTREREITERLHKRDMIIEKRREIVYSAALLDALYDHMSEDARVAIRERMCEKPGIALLLANTSVGEVLALVGSKSNPAECAPGTLRALYGHNAPEERMAEWPWWENAIHRPIDEREAVRDLALLFPHT